MKETKKELEDKVSRLKISLIKTETMRQDLHAENVKLLKYKDENKTLKQDIKDLEEEIDRILYPNKYKKRISLNSDKIKKEVSTNYYFNCPYCDEEICMYDIDNNEKEIQCPKCYGVIELIGKIK